MGGGSSSPVPSWVPYSNPINLVYNCGVLVSQQGFVGAYNTVSSGVVTGGTAVVNTLANTGTSLWSGLTNTWHGLFGATYHPAVCDATTGQPATDHVPLALADPTATRTGMSLMSDPTFATDYMLFKAQGMDDKAISAALFEKYKPVLQHAIKVAVKAKKHHTVPHLRHEKLTHMPKLHHKDFAVHDLPASVDMRSKFIPVYEQGPVESCTANAAAAVFAYHHNGFLGSRLFLYFNERLLEHTVNADSGATPSLAVQALYTNGICTEASWPYNPALVSIKPSDTCYTEACATEGIVYHHVAQTVSAIKAALANGFPLMVGIMIFESFQSDATAKTGIVTMPTAGDTCDGGHAVVVVGYDNAKNGGSWIMRNSWGAAWGDKGYFYLPYAYLTDHNLAMDIYLMCPKGKSPTTHAPTPLHAFANATPYGGGKPGNINLTLTGTGTALQAFGMAHSGAAL